MVAASSSTDNPQAGAGRPLPKKEADAFRNVVKHYEMKQYKKAIKQADSILKRFPNHGETLAMKGLTLNYMGSGGGGASNKEADTKRKEEAHALVKEGLRNDMRSHVCWHVYGLLHRSDRNYAEAIKAYKQALRIEPHNQQILRDLSNLQVQLRDVHGFVQTRNILLSLRPSAKLNWMAFAVANHLNGQQREAVKVIDTYLRTLTEDSEELGRCYESSELALYKNQILAEVQVPDGGNNYKEALDHLGVCEGIVVDRVAWLMTRATYQVKLQDYVGAKQSVMAMLDRGMTEDHHVHSLYMLCTLCLEDAEENIRVCEDALRLRGTQTIATMMPLTREQKEKLREAYRIELAPSFPKSAAVRRIPLTLLEDDSEMKSALEDICRQGLSRGVPSLISELMSFVWVENKDGKRYVKPADAADIRGHVRFQMITAIVDSFLASLSSCSKFSADDEATVEPSVILWTWYLRAGLHELAGEYMEGIALLDRCIERNPEEVDVYELKARLLKEAGDIASAVECLDKARELDKQDRYINSQTTKYMLQAGMEDQALQTISLFAKHEGNPEQNLFDMQCSWYENELAASYERKKQWGKSLKKYGAVVKHFEDIVEDQFDFHNYCLRKVTLRAYIDVLRFEDEVYGQAYYCRAAAGIVRIYLYLYDHPIVDESAEPDYSKMTAAERKKAKAIARKKKKAAEKKAAIAEESNADNGGNNNNKAKSVADDPDPFGEELVKKNPIEEATKYAAMLSRYSPKNIETWLLAYDVAIRRKKALMALQALHKARSIDSSNGELLTRIIDFAGKVGDFKDLPPPVQQVLVEETPPLLNGKSAKEFVESVAASAKSDALTPLPTRVAIAKLLVDTKSGVAADACAIITDGGVNARNVTVESCRQAANVLKSIGDASVVDNWTASVKKRFPLLSEL